MDSATPSSAIPIAASVQTSALHLRGIFNNAEPFRHVLMDDFFEAEFAALLLRDFPRFDPALAKNEIYGGVWGKSANTNIREISPVYHRLYDVIASREFLDLVGRISGIDGLLADPKMYGGGTHENLHGQALDPHVDFNYDESEKLHRRLNLIVYLNHGWQAEWGGALEIHSNPRSHSDNRVTSFDPIFNRAVLFETNEYSWHGFPKIQLPESERHRSRKSISIYLYTRERPAHEIAPMHGTFYVQRPLPDRLRAGYTLDDADITDLLFEIDRRDKWIAFYQRMELAKNREITDKKRYIADLQGRVRAPLTGYALQDGTSSGLFPDGWVASECAFTIRPLEPVRQIILKGWRPDDAPTSASVSVLVNGVECASCDCGAGVFEAVVEFGEPLKEPFSVTISANRTFQPEGDHRQVAFVLMEIRTLHA